MSALALQRVAVRMLYDPQFVDAVYSNASRATADCEISDTEREWLLHADRRAWGVDPLRRSRSLAALIEEFSVSVAVFVRTQPDAAARLDSFFSSDQFHDGMQAGRSLASLFAEWFLPRLDRTAAHLLPLEAALARTRRAAEASLPSCTDLGAASLVLAGGVEVLELAEGTLAGWTNLLGVLRQGPVSERAIDPECPLPGFDPGPGHEGVLVDARGGDPVLERMSVELARVLRAAAIPVTFEDFCREAARHGAGTEDCRSIVESFASDGILEGSFVRRSP